MTNYKILRNVAIVLGVFSFLWFIFELINNYKTINSDYLKANNFFIGKNYQEAFDLYK